MKQKTISSAKKRVKFTGSNKLMFRKMSAQHLSAGKSKRTRRGAGRMVLVSAADTKKIKRMLPNR